MKGENCCDKKMDLWNIVVLCITLFISCSSIPLPTPVQLKYQQAEIIATIGFQMDTYAYDDGDPVFNSPVLSSVVPTATFGAYLYADNFYASIALPQLLSSTFTVKDEYNDNSLIEGGLTNHIFVGGGYIKDINDAFTIEPSLLLMLSSPAPASVELMTKLTYKDLLWTALSYRFNDAACMYIGVDIDERFYFAYAHDFVTSELSTVTSGTNEFKLGFRFNKAK